MESEGSLRPRVVIRCVAPLSFLPHPNPLPPFGGRGKSFHSLSQLEEPSRLGAIVDVGDLWFC